MKKSQKIQKIIANLGYGSRRKIESYIKRGSIKVNGNIVSIGQRYDDTTIKDLVINGEKKHASCLFKEYRIILYNKPKGEICSRFEYYHTRTVFDRLPILKYSRWINVGRLDINSSGLLLFTNNGEIAYKLTHPSSFIKREYLVRVFGRVSNRKLHILTSGIKIQDQLMKFDKIECIKKNKNMWFKISLYEGKNREIRRLWNAVNVQVSRLIRVRYGDFCLPKKLDVKKWIELRYNVKKWL